MKLINSKVLFNQEEHTYTLDGRTLGGVTSLLSRQLFPGKYKDVPVSVLDKAKDRGSLIHEVCELIDTMGISHELPEAQGYISLKNANALQHEASEYLVSDCLHVASSIDKVYRLSEDTFSLADIKTTYRIDEEYVRWQLSVYAFLFEWQNPGAKVKNLFAIWLRGTNASLVPVERIADDIIIRLLRDDAEGKQFANPFSTGKTDDNMPEQILLMEAEICEIEKQVAHWEKRRKDLMDEIMNQMVKAGAYKWSSDKMTFTRRQDTIRKQFDAKAFRNDHEELYNQYVKDTPYKGSVTLKLK